MNIFKVMASTPRMKMPEDQMSAVMGWLLHPDMEHGLNTLFLERLLKKAFPYDYAHIIEMVAKSESSLKWSLEHDVGVAIIDIVFIIEDFVFAIENKIRYESLKENQLTLQYDGLREKYPDKKIMHIYLVPSKFSKAETEFGRLRAVIKPADKCYLATWNDSICDVIEGILRDEENCVIDSISEIAKNILQSMVIFIKDRFRGYDFTGGTAKTENQNRENCPHVLYSELKTKTYGFVGVELKYQNLYNMSKERILSSGGFKYYDSPEDPNWPFWHPIQEFLDIAEQIVKGETDRGRVESAVSTRSKKTLHIIKTQGEAISGNKPNSPRSIYSYIKQPDSEKIFVGISGGKRAFEKMNPDKVKKSAWYVCYQYRGDNWISDSDFAKIYEDKMGF